MTGRARGAAERLGLVALGCGLETLSMPPGPVPEAVFAADAPFLWLLWHRGGARVLRWAWLYGAAKHAVGLRWLAQVHWAEVAGAASFLALLYVAWAIVLRWTVARGAPWLFAVPVTAVLVEWAQTVWLGGMPWPARSLAFAAWPAFLGASAVFGAYGLSFLAALGSAWVSGWPALLRAGPLRAIAGARLARAAVVLAVVGGLAAWVGAARVASMDRRIASGEVSTSPPLVLVQAVVPQSLKHSPSPEDRQAMFDRHRRLSGEGLVATPRAMAVLWPETMIPWSFVSPSLAIRFPEAWKAETLVVQNLAAASPPGTTTRYLVGAEYWFEGRSGSHESLHEHDVTDSLFYLDAALVPEHPPLVDAADPSWRPPWEKFSPSRHDKVVLVPGGEYTPLGDWIPALRAFKDLVSPIPELTAGDPDQEPFRLATLPPRGGAARPRTAS